MTNIPLQPGERIVALSSLVQSVAIIAGVITAGVVAWIAKHSWLVSVLSIIVGSIIGFVFGMIAARIFYSTPDGMVRVVRAGASSLPATIRAGLISSLLTSLAVAVAAIYLLHAPAQTAFTTSLILGAFIGVACACLGSLL